MIQPQRNEKCRGRSCREAARAGAHLAVPAASCGLALELANKPGRAHECASELCACGLHGGGRGPGVAELCLSWGARCPTAVASPAPAGTVVSRNGWSSTLGYYRKIERTDDWSSLLLCTLVTTRQSPLLVFDLGDEMTDRHGGGSDGIWAGQRLASPWPAHQVVRASCVMCFVPGQPSNHNYCTWQIV